MSVAPDFAQDNYEGIKQSSTSARQSNRQPNRPDHPSNTGRIDQHYPPQQVRQDHPQSYPPSQQHQPLGQQSYPQSQQHQPSDRQREQYEQFKQGPHRFAPPIYHPSPPPPQPNGPPVSGGWLPTGLTENPYLVAAIAIGIVIVIILAFWYFSKSEPIKQPPQPNPIPPQQSPGPPRSTEHYGPPSNPYPNMQPNPHPNPNMQANTNIQPHPNTNPNNNPQSTQPRFDNRQAIYQQQREQQDIHRPDADARRPPAAPLDDDRRRQPDTDARRPHTDQPPKATDLVTADRTDTHPSDDALAAYAQEM